VPRNDNARPRPRLTAWHILRTDWPAFGSLVLLGVIGVVVPCLAAANALWPGASPPGPDAVLVAGACVTLTALALAGFGACRVWRIHHVFARGVVVPGRIASVSADGETVGYAEVAFTHDGRAYRITQVFGTATGYDPSVGNPVEVIIDPARPAVGFVVAEYVS